MNDSLFSDADLDPELMEIERKKKERERIAKEEQRLEEKKKKKRRKLPSLMIRHSMFSMDIQSYIETILPILKSLSSIRRGTISVHTMDSSRLCCLL